MLRKFVSSFSRKRSVPPMLRIPISFKLTPLDFQSNPLEIPKKFPFFFIPSPEIHVFLTQILAYLLEFHQFFIYPHCLEFSSTSSIGELQIFSGKVYFRLSKPWSCPQHVLHFFQPFEALCSYKLKRGFCDFIKMYFDR